MNFEIEWDEILVQKLYFFLNPGNNENAILKEILDFFGL